MKFFRFMAGLFKLILWISIPLALGVGGLYLYTQTKDWNKDARVIADEVQRLTGRQLFIKGGVSFKFFPRPTLTLKDARLDNLPGAATDSLATIPQMIITPSLLSLVTGNSTVDDITLISPTIALEILPDGRKSWDLTIGRSTVGAATGTTLPIARVTLKDAVFKGYNQQTKYETKLLKVSGTIIPEGLQGAMKFNGTITRGDEQPLGLSFDTGAIASLGTIPLTASLQSGNSQFTMKGTLQDIGTNNAQYAFTMDGQLDQKLLPFGNRLARTANPLVKIAAQVSGHTKMLNITKLNIDGPAISGQGEGTIDLTKPRPSLKINLLLSQALLEANVLLPEGAATLTPTATPGQAATDPSFRVGDIGFGKYHEINLLNDVDIVFDLGITQAKFQKELLRNVRINVSSTPGGGLELRNLSVLLPGETSVEAKGTITDDGSVSDMAARFVGNIKVSGNSLKQFLSWLKVELPTIPKDKLNAFALSANAIFSKREVAVPALVARFDDTSISGGSAVVSNDPTKPSQVSLTMDNLNLDLYLPKFEDLIKEAGGSEQEAQYEKINAIQRRFDFLRVVQASFGATDLTFTINNLIYKGEPVSKASSRIRFGAAQLELSDIDIVAKNVQLHGKIQIDASGLRPFVNADLEVEDFNTADIPGLRLFFSSKQNTASVAQPEGQTAISERWSKDALDLHDMQAYDGKAHLFFRSLTHQNVLFENVTIQMHFKESFFTADSIRGNVFDGGKFDGNASFNIATQPTLSLSFALSNASIKEALLQLFNVKAISEGRFSTSGSISTIGNDIHSMIARLEGSLNLIVRGAKIEGFDLVTLTQSLAQILGAKQMRDLADAALRPGAPGSMYYDYAAGNVILSAGTLGMKDLEFFSPNFPPLFVNGNVNLAGWNYDIVLKTGLPLSPSGGFNLRREPADQDVPLFARIQGSIDNPTIVWEKGSIQKYWETRFYHQTP